MINFNFIGRCGNDATIKEVKDTTVINFSIAVDQSYKDKDDKKHEKTLWIECEVWNKKGLHPHIKKGDLYYITGTPKVEGYLKKDSNEVQSKLICQVEDLEFLSPKKEN
jgi:single-strand DNA-binding protein